MLVRRLRCAVAGPLAGVLLLGVWGVAVEPRLVDERAETAHLRELPPAWEGRRVALISDLQVGMWLANTDTVRRIVARIVELRPTAVLVAGDLVYEALPDPGREAGAAAALLRPLTEAGIPTYAVLGNHDYGTERVEGAVASQVRDALRAVRVRVLENEAVPLEAAGAPSGAATPPLYLVGIGAHRPGEDRPAAAVRQVPPGAARLVFMHNPASFPALPAGSAPVALAGHTHGGQVRVPFAPAWTLAALAKRWPQYADGWITGYGEAGNHLYVNRGIGFSVAPVRIGAPPELTLLTLRVGERGVR